MASQKTENVAVKDMRVRTAGSSSTARLNSYSARPIPVIQKFDTAQRVMCLGELLIERDGFQGSRARLRSDSFVIRSSFKNPTSLQPRRRQPGISRSIIGGDLCGPLEIFHR